MKLNKLLLPTRYQALDDFFAKWKRPQPLTERVATSDAYGRVLAEDEFALCDKPVFRESDMDGVAVKSERFTVERIPDASGWKLGVDYVRADTGDDFDDAFDAVIAIEDVEILPDGGLRFIPDEWEDIETQLNISPKGDSLAKGTLVGAKGTKLTPSDLAALAVGGVSEVTVFAKPKVAFIPTGSELIPLGTLPKRGQSVDANSVMAKNMLLEMGAEPLLYPIVRDDRELLTVALDKALAEADIVVLNAGTSKGGEDFNHALLAERGELICHGVAAAPGKPLALAIIDGKPVINVAGPPIAAFNGLDWCVRAIIHAYLGQPPLKRRTVRAKLAEPIIDKGGEPFESIKRVIVEETPDGFIAHPLTHRHSTVDTLTANGLYVTKLTPEPTAIGDVIEVDILR
jgi:molybdopterin molybdotransferase/putative molybdopterin biosynthesis protein